MIPMWPMQRFGWGGSVAVWLIAVIGVRAIARNNPELGTTLGIVFLIYAAYTWTWPAILKRLIRA